MFELQNSKMPEKVCRKCNESKDHKEFYNRKQSNDGKDYNCKKCTDNYHKNYLLVNKKSDDVKLKDYLNYKLLNIKRQDKNKFPEYESNLTVEDLIEVYKKYKGVCVYSGKKLKPGSKANIYVKISFDRLDNSKPHEKDNLQLTSVFMNMFKGSRTHEEFLDLINNS